MVFNWKVWVLTGFFALQVGVVQAKDAQAKELQEFLDGLKTISAEFVQTKEEEQFFRVETSTGTLDLVRPGKMRWDYHSPDEQHIIVDGVRVWIHDVPLKQATAYSLAEIGQEIPLAWLLFDTPISESYRIIPAGGRGGLVWYNLQPKARTFFQSVEIGVKDGVMQEVWLYQDRENITKVKFKNIRINERISPRAFEFMPPNGVDLMGNL